MRDDSTSIRDMINSWKGDMCYKVEKIDDNSLV